MTDDTIHTCSYSCERPGCIRAQRDELVARLTAAQQPAVDGCHCGTCTCDPNMAPAVRFDLSPAQTEGAIREHLIRLGWTPPDEVEALRAERDVLARENEAMKRCATKYLGWLGVTHMPLDEALRRDMSDPTMCGDAALAQQHGGSTDG